MLTDVKGQVQVKAKKGHKVKKAKEEMTVFEGDRIITKADSSANLKLFDGSVLAISPKTEFVLTALQKPSADDKILKFKLVVGELLAAVEKLTTSKSSFEIEAGGVVCGVRGTKFRMNNDGKPKPIVQLQVLEGVVYTIDSHGNKYFFRPGPPIKFANSTISDAGKKQGSINPPANNPGNPGGNNGSTTGLNDLSNTFHGNINLNQGKNQGAASSNVITVKPVVGN
jgi:hypothetical protein